jgi:hypothetical protein
LQIGTNTTTTEETTAERLQRQIDAIRFKNELESFFSEEYLLLFNGDAEFHCWAAIKKMVLFASEFLSHNVVDFWKLCLAYREGRFAIQGVSVAASSKADRQVATAAITSTNSTDKQSRRKQEATALPPQAPAADKCLLMLSQITNAVVFPVATALRFILQGSPDGERLLNSVHMRDLDIFTALADHSDNSTLSEADEQRSSVTITAANSDSSGFNQNMARHLVGCCQFLPGLLNGLTSAAREFHRSIQAVSGGANADLFDEMTRPVQELISALQSAAIQRLLDGWKCESSLFYRHEDWALGDGECSSSVRLFGKLQKSLLRSAFMLSTQTEFDSSLLRAVSRLK